MEVYQTGFATAPFGRLISKAPVWDSKPGAGPNQPKRAGKVADIIARAKTQGFQTTLPADGVHVTVAYSSTPMDGARQAMQNRAKRHA